MELTLAVEKRFDVASNQVPENLGQLWALAQGLIAREPPKRVTTAFVYSRMNACVRLLVSPQRFTGSPSSGY